MDTIGSGNWSRAACRAAALTLLLVSGSAPAEETSGQNDTFRVCLASDNEPFSVREPEAAGIDAEVAQLLANTLGMHAGIVWVEVPLRGGLKKALRNSVTEARCEVFLGVPVAAELEAELGEIGVVTTHPYLLVGYVPIVRASEVASFTPTRWRKARVGARTATPADLFLIRSGFDRLSFADNGDVVKVLQAGEIDAGLVWTPSLAALRDPGDRTAVASRDDLIDYDALPEPLRWGMAGAVRADASSLLARINAAIERLTVDGEVRRITERHHLPYLAKP